MEASGNELAIYVSHNKEIKHFPKDECEGMVMFVKLFQMKLESDGGKDELSQWLRKIAQDAKQSVLGRIFNHVETQKYLLLMDAFDPHFNHLKVYSRTWVKTHLHNVSGG